MSKAIFLVGFMGSGKSTIGRRLAETLAIPFVDLDDDIVALTRQSIADVFTSVGEQAFRDLEHAALAARVQRGEALVLALGGGAFTFARNRELLAGAGTSVWLDCPFEVASRRVAGFAHRPLANNPAEFRALFDKRRPHYSLADVHIPIRSDDLDEAVQAIVEALQ